MLLILLVVELCHVQKFWMSDLLKWHIDPFIVVRSHTCQGVYFLKLHSNEELLGSLLCNIISENYVEN